MEKRLSLFPDKILGKIFILPFLFLSVFIFSHCNSENKGKAESDTLPKNKTVDVPVPSVAIDTAARLKIILDSIHLLSASFEYKKLDFPYPTYYHKNWWGGYLIADKALTAGLDSSGKLFLVSMYEGEMKLDHYAIRVTIGNQTWTTKNADNPSLLPVILSLRPTNWEVNTYSDEDELFQAIAQGYKEDIWYDYIGKKHTLHQLLIKKNKIGIRDCYLLSQLINKKNKLQSSSFHK